MIFERIHIVNDIRKIMIFISISTMIWGLLNWSQEMIKLCIQSPEHKRKLTTKNTISSKITHQSWRNQVFPKQENIKRFHYHSLRLRIKGIIFRSKMLTSILKQMKMQFLKYSRYTKEKTKWQYDINNEKPQMRKII